MVNEKKFLDQTGVQYLWSQLSLEDYPNNETLIAVLNAIDETKADKDELFSGSWEDLKDKPFGYKDEYVTIIEEQEYVNNSSLRLSYFYSPGNYRVIIDQTNIYTITKAAGANDFGDSTYQDYPFFMEFSSGQYYITFEDQQSHLVEFKKLNSIPYPIDEIFIPETFAQVDYVDTQINTHTHDFESLTNKPFYENVTLTRISQGTVPGRATASLQNPLTKGEYSIKFNDVEYIVFVDENTTKISSNDLPFIINKNGNETVGIRWTISSVDTTIEKYNYEINLVERDLKQLDKKFIPNEITDKIKNCLTNEDILIISLTIRDLITAGWRDLVKDASAKGQYILINLDGVYYNVKVTDNNYCIGYAPISNTEISKFEYNLNEFDGSQVIKTSIVLEKETNKISTWDDKKSSSTINYPSINAMEEYVQNQLNEFDFSTLELITLADIDAICGSAIVSASEVKF